MNSSTTPSSSLAPSQKRKKSPASLEKDRIRKRAKTAEYNRLKAEEERRKNNNNTPDSEVVDLVSESDDEMDEEQSEWESDDEIEEVEDEEAELQAELRVTRSRAQIGIDGDKEVISFTTEEQHKRDQIASEFRIKEIQTASECKIQEIKTKGMIDLLLTIVQKQPAGEPLNDNVLKVLNGGDIKLLLQ